MNYRKLGKTGFDVSEISLGTWQVGGKWGEKFNHGLADKILNTALDSGINFIDTADVYSDGESEKAVGKFIHSRKERIHVATKCGRKLNPHNSKAYTIDALRKFIEDSLQNLRLETLDLIQLHCPPTEVYYRPEIFDLFEKPREALKAIEYPKVTTVQIIFNIFRQRPSELFFKEAKQKNVGIIVRVPLASGLLSGTFNKLTSFSSGDHRNFNQHGEAFDQGETFSGIDYGTGLAAVEEFKKLFPQYSNLRPIALKWILMFREVSCIIPGASKPEQVESNLHALKIEDFTNEQINNINSVYEHWIKPQVHQKW